MKMTRDNKSIKALVGAFLAATAFVSVVQLPAMAYVSDPVTIKIMERQRQDLMMQERYLMQDMGNLNRQIDTIRRNPDVNSKRQYFDLCRLLDQKYRDLQQTRQDIRNCERYMM